VGRRAWSTLRPEHGPGRLQLMELPGIRGPRLPELRPIKFTDVFPGDRRSRARRLKIGVGGYLVSNPIQLAGLKECYPQAKITRADDLMVALRRISRERDQLHPGRPADHRDATQKSSARSACMTELQLVGIAQKSIYENGAEYEGLPCTSSARVHAARHLPLHRTGNREGGYRPAQPLGQGDGYSPSIGMPVSMGRCPAAKGRPRRVRPGGPPLDVRPAEGRVGGDVARDYIELFKKRGYYGKLLYGPCHGDGADRGRSTVVRDELELPARGKHDLQVDSFVSTRNSAFAGDGVVIPGSGRAPLPADREPSTRSACRESALSNGSPLKKEQGMTTTKRPAKRPARTAAPSTSFFRVRHGDRRRLLHAVLRRGEERHAAPARPPRQARDPGDVLLDGPRG